MFPESFVCKTNVDRFSKGYAGLFKNVCIYLWPLLFKQPECPADEFCCKCSGRKPPLTHAVFTESSIGMLHVTPELKAGFNSLLQRRIAMVRIPGPVGTIEPHQAQYSLHHAGIIGVVIVRTPPDRYIKKAAVFTCIRHAVGNGGKMFQVIGHKLF